MRRFLLAVVVLVVLLLLWWLSWLIVSGPPATPPIRPNPLSGLGENLPPAPHIAPALIERETPLDNSAEAPANDDVPAGNAPDDTTEDEPAPIPSPRNVCTFMRVRLVDESGQPFSATDFRQRMGVRGLSGFTRRFDMNGGDLVLYPLRVNQPLKLEFSRYDLESTSVECVAPAAWLDENGRPMSHRLEYEEVVDAAMKVEPHLVVVLRYKPTGIVAGQLLDGIGAPVPGQPVWVFPHDPAVAAGYGPPWYCLGQTDVNGRFEIANVQLGDCVVCAGRCYSFLAQARAEVRENDTTWVDLNQSGVTGRITDAAGQPIAGARVRLGVVQPDTFTWQDDTEPQLPVMRRAMTTGPDMNSAYVHSEVEVTTDDDGRYVHPFVPFMGRSQMSVQLPDGRFHVWRVELAGRGAQTLDRTWPDESADDVAARLTVMVCDEETGRPVTARVVVRLESGSGLLHLHAGESDGTTGFCDLADVPAGAWRVMALVGDIDPDQDGSGVRYPTPMRVAEQRVVLAAPQDGGVWPTVNLMLPPTK